VKLRWIAWIAVIGLAGCAGARMISTSDGSNGPRGGVIEYRASGASSKSELEDAKRQMEEFCRPASYKVVESQERVEKVMVGYGDDMLVTWKQGRFECQ
jgi:hypothetical protein